MNWTQERASATATLPDRNSSYKPISPSTSASTGRNSSDSQTLDNELDPTDQEYELSRGHTHPRSLSDEFEDGGGVAIDEHADVPPVAIITELIVVCGHAICTDSRNSYDAESWLLQSFQRADPSAGKSSEHNTFLQHISAGASHLRNPSSLLVFSGGKTHTESDIAEGFSYGQVLLHNRDLHSLGFREATLQRRVVAECSATDSYQNLLFSMIYFWEKVGTWPESITIVTHAFKQDRFLECHSNALRWPKEKIRVQGINPPFTSGELREVTEFESKCREQFQQDPYGVRTPLSTKRKQRRWDDKTQIGVLGGIVDESIKEQLQGLLEWTGGESGKDVYPYPLPWDR